MTNGPEFERLESHLRGSWLARMVTTGASAWLAAGNGSTTAGILRRVRGDVLHLPDAGRVRAVAAFVATAVIGHLALLAFVPAYIAPALPKSFWILVGLTALVVATAADRLTNAWQSSFFSRVWRAR